MTSGEDMWLAILAMAIVTWLLRALPFLVNRHKPGREGQPLREISPVFAALGPSLLGAITIITLIPGIRQTFAAGWHGVFCYVAGIVSTLAFLRLTSNAGVAVIAGVGVYALALALMA